MLRSSRRVLRSAWAPSPLRRLVRHRWFRAAALVILVVVTIASFDQERRRLDDARASWGTTAAAVHVTEFVPAGDRVSGSVQVVQLPEALLPAGASALPMADDAVAAVDLYPGEVLLDERLVGPDGRAQPAGTVAVAVEPDGPFAFVQAGDLVDVWVTDTASLTAGQVAEAVVVLGLDDDELTLAVPHERVERLVVASLRPVTVVRR